MDNNEVMIFCTWKSSARVEIPEGMTKEEAIQAINSDLPEWAAEQINSSTAELVDWDA
jgi:hypothetical protein